MASICGFLQSGRSQIATLRWTTLRRLGDGKGTSRSLIMFQGQQDVTRCAASTTGNIEQHDGSSLGVCLS